MLDDLRFAVLDRIKRRAIRQLHASSRGEAWLLQTYLEGEEFADGDALTAELAGSGPRWLTDGLAKHAEDERKHAQLFRARLREIGATERKSGNVERLSRGKLKRLGALAAREAGSFAAGKVVPLLAIAGRMEKMSVRIFARHIEELPAGHATAQLLREVLADEKRHADGCEKALARLVTAEELPSLERVYRRVDEIERSFGVTGAVALWVVGVALRSAA